MNAGSLPVAYLLAALVYRTLYAVIGGCVTAAIGRKPEAPIILGALMLGVGIGGLLFHQAGEPIWSVALAPILSAFAATFAGFAWLGHQRRN
jgi:hypothetical protein